MPADDSLFEKAMARQLRDNPAGDGRDAEKRDVCPDAEILAAYHERLLGNDEMVLCKEHIASCGRCEQVLAALEATDDVLVNAGPDSELAAVADKAGVALPMAAARFTDLKSRTQRVTGATPIPASAAGAASDFRARGAGRRSRNYWILSAGAIAALFVVFLGVTGRTKFGSAPKLESVKVVEGPQLSGTQLSARNEPAVDAIPRGAQDVPATPRAQQDTRSVARDRGKDFSLDAKRGRLAEKKIPAENAPPSALQPQGNQSAPLAIGGAIPAAAPPPAPAPAKRAEADSEFADSLTQSKRADATEAKVQTETAGANASDASKTAALDTQDKETQAASALMKKQAVQSSRSSYGMVAARSKATDPHLIAAPGGNVIWRVGAGGRIEQSTDAGATWKLQNSGVTSALNIGSAPSDTVCWVAGAAGTILLTSDGGGHWTKLASPLAGEPGGISAADALHATIWDAAHGNTFVTSDGGVTWTRPESKPL